ncbi:hypothetical protein SNOG_14126 [Parastagonospora nodorum SN15]|uniref:Uncharacterized protein n=1 Tax=Phaeosphaeria nodorum (strain SN15 / ATCC MYA-4574 / FGSC 10173) TaxID=321614 RepID=Q0U1V8_PHANO|nr:hypothetical protein SNOG_14126 [Parastagonospora nodorum SN15]EAT78363.1 hypothetical protein SNOG_14126 [Parastagonospora nodorum SN15]
MSAQYQAVSAEDSRLDSFAPICPLSTAYVSFHWNTPWGAPNATDADRLWENINTAHGHIAIDHAWASENNLDVDSGQNQWIFLDSLVKDCTSCKPTISYTAFTPLYGKGDRMAGDGQLHQCRDWNELRDYATKNTACFRDHEPGMSYEDLFSVCDDGTDGLEQL